MQEKLPSYSKVNLFLLIKERREDGLHELESLFWPLDKPCDYLYIRPVSDAKNGLQLSCSLPGLEKEKNILNAVYKKFAEHTGFEPGLKVYLKKNIPLGAGLGGGSSNAAVLLKYLWELTQKQNSWELIREIALELGSDVPFFLQNAPAFVSGVGERVEPLDLDLSEYSLLLAAPEVFVHTAQAYRDWDNRKNREKYLSGLDTLLTKERNSNIQKKFTTQICMSNSFEKVILPKYPQLRMIKEKLLKYGACGACLTGSGSAIAALFRESWNLEKAYYWLAERGIGVYICNL